MDEAREQVDALKRQVDDDPGAMSRKQQAARERAARERQERVQQALDRLPEMEEMGSRAQWNSYVKLYITVLMESSPLWKVFWVGVAARA